MKRLFLSFTVLTSLFALAIVTSCAEDDTDSVSFSSFSVSPTEIGKLYVGQTAQIEVATEPSVTIEEYVKFSVSPISPNKTAVVIDDYGVVTAVSAGDAIIAVSSMNGDWTELVDVSVFDVVYPVTSVAINGAYDLNADGYKEFTVFTNAVSSAAAILNVTISPEEATTTDDDIVWSCVDTDNNGSVILENGSFTPGTGVGKVYIYATLFDSYAFYDDEYTEDDLVNEDLVASYTYSDVVVADFVEAYITFSEGAIDFASSLEVSTAPFMLDYSMKVPYSNPEVVWSSSNMAIATVDPSTGLVTIEGAGSVTITATCNDVVGTIVLNVAYVDITSIAINEQNETVDSGETKQFTVAVNDNADPAVAWSIDPNDTTGSSISSTGLFTAGGYKGSVKVIATSLVDNSFYAEATVAVNVPVASVEMPSAISAVAGSTVDLSALVVFNPSSPSDSSLNWSSSSSSITVTNGVVTIPSGTAAGTTAIITATSADNTSASASCTITVASSITSVSSVVITGKTGVTITNASATTTLTADSAVFWSSSDSNVATVDATTGVVTALAEGTVTITATSTVTPTVSKTHTITVSPTRVTSFTISAISVVVGKSAAVVPTIAPSTATYQGYTMAVTSGAENILFDAETGSVIGNAIGTAVITISSEDPTASDITCTVTVSSGAGIGNLEEGEGSFVIM
ncbi:MAG: Ig-like domain-containing protein [Rikenellaceae bacterium]